MAGMAALQAYLTKLINDAPAHRKACLVKIVKNYLRLTEPQPTPIWASGDVEAMDAELKRMRGK